MGAERHRSPGLDRVPPKNPGMTGLLVSGDPMDIESRLKTALDESRLLILGAQVLFGFQFEAVFQERFSEISEASRLMHNAGLVLLLICISLLIAPSLFHQIIFRGESRPGAIGTATML